LKTKYSSLVQLKKNKMMESEKAFLDASTLLQNAQKSLDIAYAELSNTGVVQSGSMQEFLQSREMINAQRNVIAVGKDRVNYAESQKQLQQSALKESSIEYEKFNYLELEEIKKELLKIKVAEQKDLDEMAVQTFMRKNKKND